MILLHSLTTGTPDKESIRTLQKHIAVRSTQIFSERRLTMLQQDILETSKKGGSQRGSFVRDYFYSSLGGARKDHCD